MAQFQLVIDSEEDLDRWLEEDQDVSYLYDKAYYACWADDDA